MLSIKLIDDDRKWLALTWSQVARRAGVSPRLVSKVCTGRVRETPHLLGRLYRAVQAIQAERVAASKLLAAALASDARAANFQPH